MFRATEGIVILSCTFCRLCSDVGHGKILQRNGACIIAGVSWGERFGGGTIYSLHSNCACRVLYVVFGEQIDANITVFSATQERQDLLLYIHAHTKRRGHMPFFLQGGITSTFRPNGAFPQPSVGNNACVAKGRV